MFWLKNHLSEDSDRKFIILMHVYPGARYEEFELWNSYPTKLYFDILAEYSNKIIMEVGGHDHLSSLRYHCKKDIIETLKHVDSNDEDFLFHNIVIAPSMTPWYSNNPGTGMFQIRDTDLIPFGLKHSFLNLRPTLGQEAPTPFDKLEFRHLDFEKEFGLTELTPSGFDILRKKLQADNVLREHYMMRVLGFLSNEKFERDQAFEIYKSKGLAVEVAPGVYNTWNFICLFTKNISAAEYAQCIS